jgi:hypothetical protein
VEGSRARGRGRERPSEGESGSPGELMEEPLSPRSFAAAVGSKTLVACVAPLFSLARGRSRERGLRSGVIRHQSAESIFAHFLAVYIVYIN